MRGRTLRGTAAVILFLALLGLPATPVRADDPDAEGGTVSMMMPEMGMVEQMQPMMSDPQAMMPMMQMMMGNPQAMMSMMQGMEACLAMMQQMQGQMEGVAGMAEMQRHMEAMMSMMQGMMPGMEGQAGLMGPWPPVMAQLSGARQDVQVTLTTWVRSRSDQPYAFDVRVPVPPGAIIVTSWAGSPGMHPGSFDGQSIGWSNPGVAARGNQGPFVVVLETGGAAVQAHPWIRFWGGRNPGEWTGASVTILGQ